MSPVPRAFVALLMLSFAIPAAWGDGERSPEGEVCSEWVYAWSERVYGKHNREERLSRARRKAREALARQAWNRSVFVESQREYRRTQGSSGDPDGLEQQQEIVRVHTAQQVYRFTEELEGGTFEETEDKSSTQVRYCVDERRFERARESLERERARRVENLIERFALVERAIEEGRLDEAREEYASLKTDVRLSITEFESYDSAISGESMTFGAWLERWDGRLTLDSAYARELVIQANQLIDDGRLVSASDMLAQALAVERREPRAMQLQEEIARLREERRALLGEAEDLAARGRFASADDRLRDATRIDSEEQASLEETRTEVQALREKFLELNPRWQVGLRGTGGLLGFDADQTGQALSSLAGQTVEVEEDPLTLGLEVRYRIYRNFGMLVSGALAQVDQENTTFGFGVQGNLVDVWQATGGLFFRSVVRDERRASFQVGGGLAYERAELNVGLPSGLENTDSQVKPFARLAVEYRNVLLFVEQGFGFESENASSPLGWNDRTSFGMEIFF